MTFDDDEVNRRIAEMEAVWADDDPRPAHPHQQIPTAGGHVVTIAIELAAASTLLAIGLATASPAAWMLGNAAFVAALHLASKSTTARPPVNDPGAAARVSASPPAWRQQVIVSGDWSDIADELRAADGLRPWCRALHVSPTDPSAIVIGRFRPVRLHLTSRAWSAEGIRIRADADGAVITASLTVRPGAIHLTSTVEVTVDTEGASSPHDRQVLNSVRRHAIGALHRWNTQRSSRPTR